jgi:hypothetical protein
MPISISSLARAFGCNRKRVTQALGHGLEPLEARGRHSALGAEIERELVLLIEENASKSTAATARDGHAAITSHYNLSVTRGWVNSFRRRDSERLCEVKSVPQATPRLEVPRCFLDRTRRCTTQFVQGHPTELVFNLDEVRTSQSEDRRLTNVIVPLSARGQRIHHTMNRELKHVSLIACVSAAGESLTPYIVTSQDSRTVRERLKKHRVRFGTDFILRHRAKSYINAGMSAEYIRMVFIPNLNELRHLE